MQQVIMAARAEGATRMRHAGCSVLVLRHKMLRHRHAASIQTLHAYHSQNTSVSTLQNVHSPHAGRHHGRLCILSKAAAQKDRQLSTSASHAPVMF